MSTLSLPPKTWSRLGPFLDHENMGRRLLGLRSKIEKKRGMKISKGWIIFK